MRTYGRLALPGEPTFRVRSRVPLYREYAKLEEEAARMSGVDGKETSVIWSSTASLKEEKRRGRGMEEEWTRGTDFPDNCVCSRCKELQTEILRLRQQLDERSKQETQANADFANVVMERDKLQMLLSAFAPVEDSARSEEDPWSDAQDYLRSQTRDWLFAPPTPGVGEASKTFQGKSKLHPNRSPGGRVLLVFPSFC